MPIDELNAVEKLLYRSLKRKYYGRRIPHDRVIHRKISKIMQLKKRHAKKRFPKTYKMYVRVLKVLRGEDARER